MDRTAGAAVTTGKCVTGYIGVWPEDILQVGKGRPRPGGTLGGTEGVAEAAADATEYNAARCGGGKIRSGGIHQMGLMAEAVRGRVDMGTRSGSRGNDACVRADVHRDT